MTTLSPSPLPALRIGNVALPNALVLAPMAGVTSHAFRLLCREHGAGLVVTELLSSHAIHYKNAKTFGMFDWTDIVWGRPGVNGRSRAGGGSGGGRHH